MPKRTIKTAIGTYINKDGVSEFGFQGDEVEVHPDHVARFDELNVENGDGEPHTPVREQVSMVSPAAGAETSGTGSGLNTSVTDDDVSESTAGDDTGDKPKRASRR